MSHEHLWFYSISKFRMNYDGLNFFKTKFDWITNVFRPGVQKDGVFATGVAMGFFYNLDESMQYIIVINGFMWRAITTFELAQAKRGL